jgi:hypothetical protein
LPSGELFQYRLAATLDRQMNKIVPRQTCTRQGTSRSIASSTSRTNPEPASSPSAGSHCLEITTSFKTDPLIATGVELSVRGVRLCFLEGEEE